MCAVAAKPTAQSPQKQKPKTSQLSYSARAHAQKGELCCSALLPSPSPTPPIPVKKKEKRKKKGEKVHWGLAVWGPPAESSRRARKGGTNQQTVGLALAVPVKALSALPSLATGIRGSVGRTKKKKRNRRSISPEINPPTFFLPPSVCFRRATDVFSRGWGGRPATTELLRLRGGSWGVVALPLPLLLQSSDDDQPAPWKVRTTTLPSLPSLSLCALLDLVFPSWGRLDL